MLFAVRFQGHFCTYLVTDIKTMIANLDSIGQFVGGGGGGSVDIPEGSEKKKVSGF